MFLELLLHDNKQEIFLVLEIRKHGAGRHTSLLRDITNGGFLVATLHEERPAGVEHLLASLQLGLLAPVERLRAGLILVTHYLLSLLRRLSAVHSGVNKPRIHYRVNESSVDCIPIYGIFSLSGMSALRAFIFRNPEIRAKIE